MGVKGVGNTSLICDIDINELHLFKIECCRAFGSNMLYAPSIQVPSSPRNMILIYYTKQLACDTCYIYIYIIYI